MKVILKKITQIIPTEYNPKSRTSTRNLKDLEESISNYGIITPILLSHSNKIIDGNRRFACAISLGLTEVPVIEYDGDPDQAYVEINSYARKVNGKEAFELWRSGGPVSVVKKRKYDKLSEFLSPQDFDVIAEHKKDPLNIVGTEVPPLLSYLDLEATNENKRKVLMWMITNNMSMAARRARKSGIYPKVIRDYIDKDQPLPY